MITIARDPESAASEHYDIIIVGGGIYGVMLLLEAVQQGQRALLLERQDFGAETSYNSLRIIHGGLRYLQTLDITRFRESVAERQWFLRTFPDLVKPMPCLMPLYNNGVKRPSVLKAALLMNDLLSAQRNKGVPTTHAIQNGRILNATETHQIFPGVISSGLTGAALWYDAQVTDSQRVIMETLLWACSLGAQAYNYVEVTDILKAGDSVSGVEVVDQETGKRYAYRCNIVINATGPSSRNCSERWDRDIPELYRPSVAWNILFDSPPPSNHALALTPDRPDAETYFLRPWKGRLLAGMGHTPHKGGVIGRPIPGKELIKKFIDDINLMLPGAKLSMDNIVHVYSGYLPVTEEGGIKLTKRAVIHDHGRNGGPNGLYSISGIKFTTARKEAERTLDLIPGNNQSEMQQRPEPSTSSGVTSAEFDWMPTKDDMAWKIDLKHLIQQESVVHLDDLVYRRTSIGDNPARVRILAEEIASLFEWDESRKQRELSNLLSRV